MPKNLPRFRREFTATDRDIELMSDWLEQWQLWKSLADNNILPEDEQGSDGPPIAVAEYDGVPEVGDIRLLSRTVCGDTDRPIYMFVLKESKGEFLVVPAGRFDVPAFPDELATGLGERLEVACSFMARIIPAPLLESSWRVGTLSELLLKKLKSHHKSYFTGLPFEKELENDLGPPVYQPEDPRYEYWRNEAALFATLDAGCIQYYTGSVKTQVPDNIIPFIFEAATLRAAAGDAIDKRIGVYIHKGAMDDLLELSGELPESGEVYGELILLGRHPEKEDGAFGEWRLEGDVLPESGSLFRILDPQTRRFIGSGSLVDEGRVAHLTEGEWQDFLPFKDDNSSLILVVFVARD